MEFSKKELIKQGWEATKANAFFLAKLLLIYIFISILTNAIQTSVQDQIALALIISLISTVISTVLEIGWIRIVLDIVDNKKPDIKELYQNYPLFIQFFLTNLILVVIVLIGTILLIIPGIYLAVRYQFTPYVVVDKKLAYLTALKEAGKLTQGRWMAIFLFDLTLIGLNILGAIALGIGLLITIPVSFLATSYLYRRLASGK